MPSYRENYIKKLAEFAEINGSYAAVLGCGFGEECGLLVRSGAHVVDGFDIDPNLGMNAQDKRINYEVQSINSISKPDNCYDIVDSAAVFEHIHGLQSAFKEAERICRPGGTIFIISSPLWYSPYGNHMAAKLPEYPWCHLLYAPKDLRNKLLNEQAKSGRDESEVDRLVNRMYDPTYFNRLPSQNYFSAAASLKESRIIRNTFWPIEPKGENIKNYLNKCLGIGYDESDLLRAGHFFCAEKTGETL